MSPEHDTPSFTKRGDHCSDDPAAETLRRSSSAHARRAGLVTPEELASGVFFIVGAPRSGTTLLQAMLSSHSKISIPPETEFFMTVAGRLDSAPSKTRAREILQEWMSSGRWIDQGLDSGTLLELIDDAKGVCDARSVFLDILQLHVERSGKPRIGEKSPHHCRQVRYIHSLFPAAKFIHIIRDPRDVVASRLRVPWSTGSHFVIAREWRRIMEDHGRLVLEMPESSYLGIRFEDLVSRPEEELRKLCSFLDENFEPGMLEFHARDDLGFTATEMKWKGRTTERLAPQRVGAYRTTLSARQIAGVERTCGSLLMSQGYSRHQELRTSAKWVIPDMCDQIVDVLKRWRRSLTKRVRVDYRD